MCAICNGIPVRRTFCQGSMGLDLGDANIMSPLSFLLGLDDLFYKAMQAEVVDSCYDNQWLDPSVSTIQISVRI